LGIGEPVGGPLAIRHPAAVIKLGTAGIAFLIRGCNNTIPTGAAPVIGFIAGHRRARIPRAVTAPISITDLNAGAEFAVTGAQRTCRIVTAQECLDAVVAIGFGTGASGANTSAGPIALLHSGTVHAVRGTCGTQRIEAVVQILVTVLALGSGAGIAYRRTNARPVALLGTGAVQPIVGAGRAWVVVAIVLGFVAGVALGFGITRIAGSGAGTSSIAHFRAGAEKAVAGAACALGVVAGVCGFVAVVAL